MSDHSNARDSKFALLAAAGLALATGFVTIRPLTDPDAWWNLRAGQYLLRTGNFSAPDKWTAFSTHDFVLTEWLGSVVAALLYAPFGPAAITWMRCVSGVVIVALIVVECRAVADLPLAVMVSLVGMLTFSGSISERPQTLGLLLLLTSILLWRRAAVRRRGPSIWVLPLAWIFAMSHGYWVLGTAVAAATTVGLALERRPWSLVRNAALLTIGTVVVAGLTPVGPRLLVLPFTVHNAASGLVDEWQRSSLDDPIVCVVGVVILVVAVDWWRTGTSWWRLLHLLLASVLLVTYVRLAAPAVAIAAPLAAEALHWLLKGRRRTLSGTIDTAPPPTDRVERRALLGAACLVVIAGTALAPVTSTQLRNTPTVIQGALATIPAGSTVLNDYDIASWLLFTQPQLQLVVDSRIEVYDPAYIERYTGALRTDPGWPEYVRYTSANWAVLRNSRPLAAALQDAGWLLVASGDGYVVLRDTGG